MQSGVNNSKITMHGWTRINLSIAAFAAIAALGVLLPWQYGDAWTESGLRTSAGLWTLALIAAIGWALGLRLARGLSQSAFEAAVLVLSSIAGAISGAFYFTQIGRADPLLADGTIHVRAGAGFYVTALDLLAISCSLLVARIIANLRLH